MRIALFSLSVLALTGCPQGPTQCTAIAITSVTVHVTDDAGMPMSDATVTYSTDIDTEVPCENWADGSYACGYEVQGDLDITVGRPNFVSETRTVTVDADECHVIGETLDVQLLPAPPECMDDGMNPSLRITVFGSGWDPSAPYPVDDATVTYTTGEQTTAATCDHESGNEYICGWDQTGEFSYTVEAGGHATVSDTAVVETTEDGCHSETLDVEVLLECIAC